MGYKNVFIDLDRTLWDFEANSVATFKEIFTKYSIGNYCNFEDFYSIYREINEVLWRDYRDNLISKEKLSWTRFYLSLEKFDCQNVDIAKQMSEDYISISPTKTLMFPYAVELLQYLKKKYKIYLITNGFKEVQYSKIKNCGIDKYFDKVYTSEEVGCNKPNREYFEFVLRDTESNVEESIVIGDDLEVDIKGALTVNVDTIWFNNNDEEPSENVTFEVKKLVEILAIL